MMCPVKALQLIGSAAAPQIHPEVSATHSPDQYERHKSVSKFNLMSVLLLVESSRIKTIGSVPDRTDQGKPKEEQIQKYPSL